MEENEEGYIPSPRKIGIKYGLITGVISIILFIALDFAGQSNNQSLQWIGIAITAVIIFLAQQEFKKEGDGFMSYGQALGVGTWLVLISAVLSSVFTYIYITAINTNYMDNVKEQQIMELEERGMSDAQIEQALNFTTPEIILVFGLVGGFIFGFIIALIISAITKKSRPEFT
jgi:tetrahydromethanopterin S-methyltransferase subunit G